MKTIEILNTYTKYNEAIKSTKINVTEKFGKFMKWLEENCEDSDIETTVKLATIHNTLKVLGERNYRYNESPEWTKTYNEEFFDLLKKLKDADKAYDNDTNPFKVFVGRMFKFLKKMNTTMYLYYWGHLYVQAFGGLLEAQTRKANQLARAENEEELARYLKNAEQTTSTNTTPKSNTPSTDEDINSFASSFSSAEEVVKNFNEKEYNDWTECARWCALHNKALKNLQHQGLLSSADYTKYLKQLVEIRFEKFPIDKDDLLNIATSDDVSDVDSAPNETLDGFADSLFKVYQPEELVTT